MQDESRGPAGRARSPPDHPARLKVENVARQVSWLAPYRPGPVERRLPAPGRSGCVDPVQCLQLRGQPRLGPRSRLSCGQRRRTSKRQGYAVVGRRSTISAVFMCHRHQDRLPPCPLTPHPPIDGKSAACFACTLRSGAPSGVKRETGAPQAPKGPGKAGAAPATVSECAS